MVRLVLELRCVTCAVQFERSFEVRRRQLNYSEGDMLQLDAKASPNHCASDCFAIEKQHAIGKLKPSPESQDSPRTRAKQPETSPKGGVLHSAPHDARMRLPPKLQNRSLRVTQGLNRVFRKLHFDSLHKRQNFGIWIEKDDQE